MWYASVATSGYCAAIARKRSSQNGMVIAMPFDLVADVTFFRGRRARELERELHDAVDALAAEHRLLEHDLALGAFVHAAADRRVLALGVLAHDDEVDVARLAAGERRRDARHQPARAQVDVLVEAAAELDQRAPQRHVVGHRRRPADGTVVDRLEARRAARTSPPASSGRASRSSRSSSRTAVNSKSMPWRRPAASSTRRPFGDHFLADAVARDDGDAMRGHRFLPPETAYSKVSSRRHPSGAIDRERRRPRSTGRSSSAAGGSPAAVHHPEPASPCARACW